MKIWRSLLLATLTSVILFPLYVKPGYSTDEQVLKPRVPAAKLSEVRGLKSMIITNTKSLAEAEEIFMGKGACFTCHGERGKGDGEAGASFSPPPRDFTDIGWQKARADGEIYWAITKGTEYGMLAYEDMLTDEERWTLVNYIRELGKRVGTISSR